MDNNLIIQGKVGWSRTQQEFTPFINMWKITAYITNFDIKITLFLHYVLSYFSASNPSLAAIDGTYKI